VKNFELWDHAFLGWGILTPANLSIGMTCYHAKFGGPAATSPIAQSSTENVASVGLFF